MKITPKWLVYPVISLAVAALDLWSKFAILAQFQLYQSRQVIGDLLRFTFTWNRGITFGTFNNATGVPDWQPFLLIGINFIILVVMIVIFFRLHRLLKGDVPVLLGRIVVSFIAGGAIGNNVDRFLHKAVVDFIDCGIGSARFFVFNVADSFVVIGAIGLGILLILFERKPEGALPQGK
jgi:signal peptidase II